MHSEVLHVDNETLRQVTVGAVVIGSGAAGLNAAARLKHFGVTDLLLITEGMNSGTSRNTGSDKQTYYKLSLGGGTKDSVRQMAEILFSGQAVDGDTALCEAALSARCFFRLTELGVPFPDNNYGEFIGYKTDHDPACRGSSAGPYTSKYMTEALEREVAALNIPVESAWQALDFIIENERLLGLIVLDKAASKAEGRPVFVAVRCQQAITATGGPAGIYKDTVYPQGHCGAQGMALRAGLRMQNLTEWQYGLSSVKPRWNVSGTYMQALPSFISTDTSGGDKRYFLEAFYRRKAELLEKVFLKGYQWPFDVRKASEGSSQIDLLVYQELRRGRRVFLDFRRNPCGGIINFSGLNTEAAQMYTYLSAAGAADNHSTPYTRLLHMNRPAVEFYRAHGVDLSLEPLEISLAAQHNNGGVAVDSHWQSSVTGLYCVGEQAGTHGVYRPGGSALNAGQVGATRAAEAIARTISRAIPEADGVWFKALASALSPLRDLALHALRLGREGSGETVTALHDRVSGLMSLEAGAIRRPEGCRAALREIRMIEVSLERNCRIASPGSLSRLFRLRDLLLAQQAYLTAIIDYSARGKSRGSALYLAEGMTPSKAEELMTAATVLDEGELSEYVQETYLTNGDFVCTWRHVRTLPEENEVFETLWRNYRSRQEALE